MSLDVLTIDLVAFKDELSVLDIYDLQPHEITKEQAEEFNLLLPGCAIRDTFEYFDVDKYAKENELDINGWHFVSVGDEQYIEMRTWNDYTGWSFLSAPLADFETFIEKEEIYLLNYEHHGCLGGKEIFGDERPPEEFYSYKDLKEFKKYIAEDYHWYDDIALTKTQLIWMNY